MEVILHKTAAKVVTFASKMSSLFSSLKTVCIPSASMRHTLQIFEMFVNSSTWLCVAMMLVNKILLIQHFFKLSYL